MLKFVSRVFEGFIDIILWLILIVFAVAGAKAGWVFGGGYAVLGFIFGAAIGLIFNVVVGGYLVTFVNMSKEISKLKGYVSELRGDVKKISSGHTEGNNVRKAANTSGTANDDAPVEVNYGPCKICGKQVDASSTEVRIYKTCNHCHSRL